LKYESLFFVKKLHFLVERAITLNSILILTFAQKNDST